MHYWPSHVGFAPPPAKFDSIPAARADQTMGVHPHVYGATGMPGMGTGGTTIVPFRPGSGVSENRPTRFHDRPGVFPSESRAVVAAATAPIHSAEASASANRERELVPEQSQGAEAGPLARERRRSRSKAWSDSSNEGSSGGAANDDDKWGGRDGDQFRGAGNAKRPRLRPMLVGGDGGETWDSDDEGNAMGRAWAAQRLTTPLGGPAIFAGPAEAPLVTPAWVLARATWASIAPSAGVSREPPGAYEPRRVDAHAAGMPASLAGVQWRNLRAGVPGELAAPPGWVSLAKPAPVAKAAGTGPALYEEASLGVLPTRAAMETAAASLAVAWSRAARLQVEAGWRDAHGEGEGDGMPASVAAVAGREQGPGSPQGSLLAARGRGLCGVRLRRAERTDAVWGGEQQERRTTEGRAMPGEAGSAVTGSRDSIGPATLAPTATMGAASARGPSSLTSTTANTVSCDPAAAAIGGPAVSAADGGDGLVFRSAGRARRAVLVGRSAVPWCAELRATGNGEAAARGAASAAGPLSELAGTSMLGLRPGALEACVEGAFRLARSPALWASASAPHLGGAVGSVWDPLGSRRVVGHGGDLAGGRWVAAARSEVVRLTARTAGGEATSARLASAGDTAPGPDGVALGGLRWRVRLHAVGRSAAEVASRVVAAQTTGSRDGADVVRPVSSVRLDGQAALGGVGVVVQRVLPLPVPLPAAESVSLVVAVPCDAEALERVMAGDPEALGDPPSGPAGAHGAPVVEAGLGTAEPAVSAGRGDIRGPAAILAAVARMQAAAASAAAQQATHALHPSSSSSSSSSSASPSGGAVAPPPRGILVVSFPLQSPAAADDSPMSLARCAASSVVAILPQPPAGGHGRCCVLWWSALDLGPALPLGPDSTAEESAVASALGVTDVSVLTEVRRGVGCALDEAMLAEAEADADHEESDAEHAPCRPEADRAPESGLPAAAAAVPASAADCPAASPREAAASAASDGSSSP